MTLLKKVKETLKFFRSNKPFFFSLYGIKKLKFVKPIEMGYGQNSCY